MPFEMDSTISIHAPREGGDKSALGGHLLIRYISIHAPREGGDRRDHLHGDGTRDFNPRPPRGGDSCHGQLDRPIAISIHAPREGGDCHRRGHRSADTMISIHAPARGATAKRETKSTSRAISIHAPREGGDGEAGHEIHLTGDFNPRPPRGGRPPLVIFGLDLRYFNPRPPRGGRRY